VSCQETQDLVHAYVDGELDLVHSIELERHMEGCEACARAYRTQQDLKRAFQAVPLRFSAPQDLRRRIRSSLGKAGEAAAARHALLMLPAWRWAGTIAALALVAVVSWNLARIAGAPSGDERVSQEVLDSHLRSLMANHLEDIPSTDQHTVKPWFNGKLDFSPPVVDLAKEGFPLVGGRLDYLQNRPVAALVYQRRKHIINLFIWPSTHDLGQRAAMRQGYNLLHWSQSGMVFWAASDLNYRELTGFANLIQQTAVDPTH
jgi:anti-sigma factor RsiW